MTQIKATYLAHMGEDIDTVNAARVSFGKTSKLECTDHTLGLYDLKEGDKKLISYLGSHEHISPFGHSFARFHVKAPIFVARQLVKHKFLRWNEISRRYVDSEPEFYMYGGLLRASVADKKQGSGEMVDEDQQERTWHDFDRVEEAAKNAYLNALEEGICPEQARIILPTSLMTEWWWSGSLDAFAAMCKLRLKEDTQYETRIVAEDVNKVMSELFPVSWKALLS